MASSDWRLLNVPMQEEACVDARTQHTLLKRFGQETGQMCGQAFTNTSAGLNKRGLVFTLNARCMQFMTENQ